MPRKTIPYIFFLLFCFSYIIDAQVVITGPAGVCTGGSATLGVTCSNFTPPQSCAVTLNMRNGSTALTPGSNVCFYDSGGPSSDYDDDESYTHTFSSNNGSPVYIYFESCEIGNGLGQTFSSVSDYLYVYDGPSTSSTRIAYSGSSGTGISGGDLYIANSGYLTVRFTSDDPFLISTTSSGWSAKVGCNAYQWSTGATSANITVSPVTATTYAVTVSGFFSGTASQNVAVANCNASACPEVAPAEFGTGATDIEVNCARPSVTLNANVVATSRTADNYFAVSIPYDPPYGFTDGNQIFTNATDDTWGEAVNLPFGFCYYGNTYTRIVPGANAVATFETSRAGGSCAYSYTASLPSSSLFTNTIFACYRDIYPNYYSGGGIYEGILGNYPCRSYMLSFNNIALYGQSSSDAESNYCLSDHSFSTMIVLYEGTNIIEIYLRDAPTCPEWNGGRGLLGIQNGDGTLATVPTGRNTGSWTTHNEAWRFIPIGDPEYTVTWYLGTDTTAATGIVLGEGDTITVTPTESGYYTARLRYIACNGESFDLAASCYVTANIHPDALTVTASQDTVCAEQPVTISASTSGAVSYEWSTGQSTASFTLVPETYTTTYVCTVTYTNSCQNVDSVSVFAAPFLPTPTFTVVSSEICDGESATITTDQEYFAYQWGSGETDRTIIVTPSATTTYTLTVSDEWGCTADNSTQVIVYPMASLSVTASQDTLCPQQPVTLTAESDLTVTYEWNTGQTTASFTTVPEQQVTTYVCTITADNNCQRTDSVTVFAVATIPPPTFVVEPAEICIGDSTTISTEQEYFSYQWNNSETGPVITVSPSVTTNYSLTVSDELGCTSEATVEVVVHSFPTLSVTATPETLCPQQSVTVAAQANISVTYEWNTGQTNATFTTVPSQQVTTYVCTATADGGCSTVDSVTVFVADAIPTPTFVIEPPEVCFGESATITTDQEYHTYQWSTGETDRSITVTPDVTTNYSLTVSDELGCTENATVRVVVHPIPVVDFEIVPDRFFLSENVEVQFLNRTDTSSFTGNDTYSWHWDFGDGNTQTTLNYNTTHSYNRWGEFAVTLELVTSFDCRNSATHTLYVEADLEFPNIITPNGDGKNDVFAIRNLNVDVPNRLVVYDRWGKKVYDKQNYATYVDEYGEVRNPEEGFTADKLSDGVYYFVFHYDISSKPFEYHSSLTVIR